MSKARRPWIVLAPLVVLAGLALVFASAVLNGRPERKSALIGKPLPAFDLPAIEGLSQPGIARTDLGKGKPVIVNFWASWCLPCREEQPALEALARASGIALVGINYKDEPAAAVRFLATYGNPFTRIGRDDEGRTGIEWGISGVPETFYVGPNGTILAHHEGPLDGRTVARWSKSRP